MRSRPACLAAYKAVSAACSNSRMVTPPCSRVPAMPARDIALAQLLTQHLPKLAQQQIARLVPERIVETLEVVEIEHRDAQRGFPATSTMQLARQTVFPVAPVV